MSSRSVLSSSAQEFLRLCEEEQCDGSGHSIEALSMSEIDKESSELPVEADEAGPCLREEFAYIGGASIPDQFSVTGSVIPATPESVVEQTPSENYDAPLAHSTPLPGGDSVGFFIYPEEVSESLSAATVRLTKKFFLS
ncbi:unnamed protein product [Nippostrongylus brasiliensis]|uniref:Clathrin_bdg domain-containing protein n=1 Tax=Nippostrongylus brasiliensis TaxID=27835 RepID=A0A0N4XUR1_NIPBR|nr:unnamed protein product [Nippostrongylus brasiliensis]